MEVRGRDGCVGGGGVALDVESLNLALLQKGKKPKE